MKKYQIALTVILVIGFIFSGFYGWQAWNAQQLQLGEAQAKVVWIESQFEEYKIQTGKQAENLQDELIATGDKLDSAKKELQAIDSNLQNTEAQLQIVKLELEAQENHYEQRLEEERELSYKTGYEKGKEDILESGILLKKPTRQELVDNWYLIEDRVVLKPYIPNKLVCIDLAAAFNNSAVKDGFQAAVVFLVYSYPNDGKGGHFINAFDTKEGLVYVEPQTHKEVFVEVGKSYSRLNNLEPESGDIIKEIIIYW